MEKEKNEKMKIKKKMKCNDKKINLNGHKVLF